MITKIDIERSLKFISKNTRLSNFQVENEINVCSPQEFSEVAMISIEESFEELGEFDYILLYSDYPDYLTINKSVNNIELDRLILDWLKELKLI